MRSNKFSYGKNIKVLNELNKVDNWKDLENYQPFPNDEIFVYNISGTNSGKVMAKFVDGKWVVPGADLNTINYTNNIFPIKQSITNPKNIEIFGKNSEFQLSPMSVNQITYNAGNESSACTFSVNIRNFSNKTVSSIKFAIHTTSNNNCTYYGKFKINNRKNSNWKYITWNSVDNITPNNENQTKLKPKIIVSDFIDVPEYFYSGDVITLYISCVGNSETFQIPDNNNSFYFPTMFTSENFGIGNFSLSGSVENWTNLNNGHPVSHVIYKYVDPTPITSIVTIGDSTFAEASPLATPVGNGWCQHANRNCRTSGIPWRICSFAQGGYGIPEFVERLKSILESDIKNYIDVIAYQTWSGNTVPSDINEYNQFIGYIDQAKQLCSSAGISFCTMCIYPVVVEDNLTNPGTSALFIKKIEYYNNMKAYISANDYNYIDISYIVTDPNGLDYNDEDSFDKSHANVGSYENQVGQFKQGKALIEPMTNMMHTLKYI